MNYRTTIVLEASSLELGDTLRYVCPRCEGGSSGEKSLSVTRNEDGTLVWQCFRATCPEKGGTGEGGESAAPVVLAEPVSKPRKVFTGTTKPLTDIHLAKIKQMWGIEDPPYWYYTPDYGGRVAMSIRSPKFMHRGWVLRDIRGNAKVKALTYVDKGEEGISWYKTTPQAGTILVEDIPSAVRAAAHLNSVALCGTGIGVDRAAEIADHAPRPIIVALDQDATSLSFKWANKYALLWGDVEVLPLPKDLKDMSEEELKEILNV